MSLTTIYDKIIRLVFGVLGLAVRLGIIGRETPLGRVITGQQTVMDEVRASAATFSRPVIWVHCASLGEYGVIRPVVKRINQLERYQILLTFFSSTGMEAMRHRHPDVDFVHYLPYDSRSHAREFLDAVRPVKALFSVSEIWPNLLNELGRRQVPTFLISGHITARHPMFGRVYGRVFRQAMSNFTSFLVLDRASQDNLRRGGFTNSVLIGDPLFDNVLTCADTPYSDAVIEAFVSQKARPVFIAGSISDERDLELVCHLANQRPDVPFIFVPHVVDAESVQGIRTRLRGGVKAHSECAADEDFSHVQVLIIDFLGALAYIYRYCTWAYVGGGFTPYLHSIMEATVYGLPISFGPRIERKNTPQQTIDLGIGQIVRTPEELVTWFDTVSSDSERLQQTKATAQHFARSNGGATDEILRLIGA